MPSDIPPQRWYQPSPDRLILGLLAVQILLFLSQQFQWFAFNERKGWTVLIATAVLGLAMVVLLLWLLASLLFRWRFQFSLRSFLLLIVVIAVPSARFVTELRRAESQRRTVAAIRGIGFSVHYDYSWNSLSEVRETGYWLEPKPPAPAWLLEWFGNDYFAEVAFVAVHGIAGNTAELDCSLLKELIHLRLLDLGSAGITDADLENLGGMKNLMILDLSGTQVTDAGIKHLRELTELRELSLDRTRVTDAGLAHLRQLTNLTHLRLYGTQITDAGVEHLVSLTRVQHLNLGGTLITDGAWQSLKTLTLLEYLCLENVQVTDAGLANLGMLPNLKELNLAMTPITDGGLEHLTSLANLEMLSLANTQVTDAGLAHLKNLPRLDAVGVQGTQVTREAYRELSKILRSR